MKMDTHPGKYNQAYFMHTTIEKGEKQLDWKDSFQ